MDRPRLVIFGLVAGAAAGVLVGAFGPLYGGLFLVPLIPFVARSGIRAYAGALVGFGTVWLGLVLNHLVRGGSTGSAVGLIVIGLVPLAVAAALIAVGSTPTGILPRPSRSNG